MDNDPSYILKKDSFVDLLFGNWFVDVILVDYILFYVIFRLYPSNKGANIATILVLSIVYYIICSHLNIPRYWYGSQLGFPLGMVWAYKEESIMNFIRKKFALPLSLLLLAVMMIIFRHFSIKFATPIVACALFVILMYSFKYTHIKSKLVIFLSSIAFELYLYHQIFIRFFVYKMGLNGMIVPLSLILIFTIIISWLAHKIALTIIASFK